MIIYLVYNLILTSIGSLIVYIILFQVWQRLYSPPIINVKEIDLTSPLPLMKEKKEIQKQKHLSFDSTLLV